jgi:hypothetical protein
LSARLQARRRSTGPSLSAWVAKDGWRAGEVVEESNSGAKKYCREVDMDFVEEASIQALLDGVSAVDPNGLPGGGASFTALSMPSVVDQ